MRVRLPLLPLRVPLTERQWFQSSKLARWVRFPQGTLLIRVNIPGSSLLVVMVAAATVRRFDSYPRNYQPNTHATKACERRAVAREEHSNAGSSNGRTGRSERLDVGSIPTPAAWCNAVLWPSGKGGFLTRRRSVVRVHPGLLKGSAFRVQVRHCCLNPAPSPPSSWSS